MDRTWAEMAAEYRARTKGLGPAYEDVAALVQHIADSASANALYGWLGMHDLCIQQVDMAPFSGPFLRISPNPYKPTIEFLYLDTMIERRQWKRVYEAGEAIEKFEQFLDNLHWRPRVTAID